LPNAHAELSQPAVRVVVHVDLDVEVVQVAWMTQLEVLEGLYDLAVRLIEEELWVDLVSP
jgi:hypothetical protein